MFNGDATVDNFKVYENQVDKICLGEDIVWTSEVTFISNATATDTSFMNQGKTVAICSISGAVDMSNFSKLNVTGNVNIKNNYRGNVDYVWVLIDNTIVSTLVDGVSGYQQQGYDCNYPIDSVIDISGYSGIHTVELKAQSSGVNYNNYNHDVTVSMNTTMKVFN